MKKFLAITLALAMVFSLAACGNKKEPAQTGYKINEPIYPVKVNYPNYKNFSNDNEYAAALSKWENNNVYLANLAYEILENKSLENFYYKTISEILSDNENKNIVYSPINVFFAFAILAEVTDGETRNEILDVLGMNDITALRNTAKKLYKAYYVDDGTYTSLLASSLWLNENIKFNRETIDNLALYYYATAYQGDMGDLNFNEEFKAWLNENTNNLLEKEVNELSPFDERDVLVIATSIYFKGNWDTKFSESFTKDNTFYTANGPISTTFMQKEGYMQYLENDKYTAISSTFNNGGKMWFILPEIDTTVEELVKSNAFVDYILREPYMSNNNVKYVEAKVPKFDISSTVDLIPKMKNMGISKVFSSGIADFSPLTNKLMLEVSSATHSARVKIDENGCEAAAFTVMDIKATAMMPQEPIIFKADRPFLFMITDNYAGILFTGIVNNPNA